MPVENIVLAEQLHSRRPGIPCLSFSPGIPEIPLAPFNPVPHGHLVNNKKLEEANLFFVTSTRTTLGVFFYHFSRSEKTDLARRWRSILGYRAL